MKRPKLSEMTLREKIGQTGLPSQREVWVGADECGGLTEYFQKYPYSGMYVDKFTNSHYRVGKYNNPKDLADDLRKTSDALKIPIFVTCDLEMGASSVFSELHRMTSNMSVGAAKSKELAYQRSYMWAKELKSMGVNWAFGPVCDMSGNFFGVSGVRCLADNPEVVTELFPSMVKGVQDAGIAATAKHFPGGGHDYRDSHFSSTGNDTTIEEWNKRNKPVWQCAVDSGAYSVMIGHKSFPAMDPSFARGKIVRPASASSKVIDILRKDLDFKGVLVTDAVSMKGLAAAFDYEDVYIECFNAGNDVILFMHNDYLDIMEKAVLEGRVSMERLDEAVERILDMKEKIGLFDDSRAYEPLTEEDGKKFDELNYNIAKKAITLIKNEGNMIPFDPSKVKSVAIIKLAPDESFTYDLQAMVEAFEKRGIEVEVLDTLKNKTVLKELADKHDIIIYACMLAMFKPAGMPFYSRPEEMNTLFNSLSFGAEKSVCASFAATSIYYNYFENADVFINAYSSDRGTMNAFVDGILGEFEFTGKSPVALKPQFKF